ncbi:MAG: hypothetical protein H6736_21550 [Alphaproteobacteria bacterium]|nr:hypothetical protein [Alphaproteobacteria bacterium]MCB9694403.1 hypothetical protein [Alphaproteobacteria bacterium]
MLWAALAVGIVAGLVLLRVRRGASAHRAHWVLTREGLVRFGRSRVHFFAWEGVELADGAVVMRLPPRVWVHGRDEEVADPRTLDPDMVRAIAGVLADPASRRALPTFLQPDGPPEAVLADLHD